MGDIESLTRRYHNDVNFKMTVDMMMHTIMNLHLSPSEVREAAMFACYRVESLYGGSQFDPRRSDPSGSVAK